MHSSNWNQAFFPTRIGEMIYSTRHFIQTTSYNVVSIRVKNRSHILNYFFAFFRSQTTLRENPLQMARKQMELLLLTRKMTTTTTLTLMLFRRRLIHWNQFDDWQLFLLFIVLSYRKCFERVISAGDSWQSWQLYVLIYCLILSVNIYSDSLSLS